jgi:ABC-type multidrug transport system ATPase subunit
MLMGKLYGLEKNERESRAEDLLKRFGLDEPTSGLDGQSSRLIRSIIAYLNTQGVTFLLTTHNMERGKPAL